MGQLLLHYIEGCSNRFRLGTCESFFSLGCPIRFRIFELNRPYTTKAVTQPHGLRRTIQPVNPLVFCTCDERCWCTDYGTPNWVLVYFNSVIKRAKQCCCTLILLPKATLNAHLTTTNRFFTNDYWQRGRFENFESDHQYESNLESDLRFEIELNHKAS